MSSLRRAQHVLVAEPRSSDLEAILAAIAKNDAQLRVSHGRTGREVIEVLKNSGKPATQSMPSLLLLDLELDEPGAIELIRELRNCQRTSCLPIVALDQGNHPELLSQAYQAGANSCLVKPPSREEFEGVIQRMTQYWLRLNQLPHQLGASGNGS